MNVVFKWVPSLCIGWKQSLYNKLSTPCVQRQRFFLGGGCWNGPWRGRTGNLKMFGEIVFVYVYQQQSVGNFGFQKDRVTVDWTGWRHHRLTFFELWRGAENGSCLECWNDLRRPCLHPCIKAEHKDAKVASCHRPFPSLRHDATRNRATHQFEGRVAVYTT